MTSLTPAEQVDSLLDALDRAPVSFDFGTAEVFELNEVHQLAAMGTAIVPQLLERIRGDVPKKRVAYITLVLNHIGDIRALAALIELCTFYQQRETKDEWDYAVVAQCNLAIEQLQRVSR